MGQMMAVPLMQRSHHYFLRPNISDFEAFPQNVF
jgi:hypothetical protein